MRSGDSRTLGGSSRSPSCSQKKAQYGFFDVSGEALKAALRQSRALLEFAEQTTRR
jgi:hypothetical protein